MSVPPLALASRVLMSAVILVFTGLNLKGEAPFEPWKTSNDPVAKMWERVCTGRTKLDATTQKGWVRSALKELGVPEASQVLVFSKTSLQARLISPKTPRSVFFNEEVYVGWVPDGMMELIGIDPVKGPQFYTMALPPNLNSKPVLEASDRCLSCHEGPRTNDVRGMQMRSVFVDEDGQPQLQFGSYLTGQESPLSERWGGWYVTGKSGHDLHMGNVITTAAKGNEPVLDRAKGCNVMSLEKFIDTSPYPAKSSDIVALMVLEHQCSMHNKLFAAAESTRQAMVRQHDLQKAFHEPITDIPQGSALAVIRSQAGKVVRHMLFSEEYKLQDGGVEGNPAFQDAFRNNRRETTDGRSLKDFQLLTRLFKNPCSYMIYSKMFDALPVQLKNEIYAQLLRVLNGEDQSKDFAHLSMSERQYIKEILLETKTDLPSDWRVKA
jgi:hypothetical protein